MKQSTGPSDKIRLGISSCLLGEAVRYDGGHKRDPYLVETLGQYVDWVPVCPEVECGLSVPREAMHLTGDPTAPRLVTVRSHIDHTERMLEWARRHLVALERENLCGFIFKSKSPSSGLERVKVYGGDGAGVGEKIGVGLWARAFIEHFPLLPVEEEGRLQDPLLRENFIERIFVLKRWRDFLRDGGRLGGLVEFQSDHKMLIMAHSEVAMRQLGKLVAGAKAGRPDEVLAQYEATMLQALKLLATPRKHANVLEHLMGFLKKHLSAEEKQELLTLIDQFKQGLVPLIVPITLLAHYGRKYNEAYLVRQVYLHPHPLELKLRNHV
jgi:uncharacterized protein YbgA (DUF1722 family)/uncharacterized protein YbbK (DUF523 family)